jgi:hypothetical protein
VADELLSACHWLEKPFRNRREDFVYSTSEPAEDTFTVENRAILDMMKSIEIEAMYLNFEEHPRVWKWRYNPACRARARRRSHQ